MPAPHPRDIERTFRTWAAQAGLQLSAPLAPADLIDRMAAFYGAVAFFRRKQGTMADMLLFQTGNPPGSETWQLDVTRQLYSRGRGHQLCVSVEIPHETHPFPGYTTFWSKDADDIAAWTAEAHTRLAAMGPLPSGAITILRAEF